MASEVTQIETQKGNEDLKATLATDALSKKITRKYQGKTIILKKQNLNPILLKPIRVKRLQVRTVNVCEPSQELSVGDMRMIGKMIRSMRKVENLRLNFEIKNKVTDRGLEAIFKRSRMLRDLKGIRFSLQGCEGMTNTGIQSFCEGLKRVRRLRKLHMNFIDWMTYGKLDLVGINEIYDTLKSLRCLKDLRLSFRDGRYFYVNMRLENFERSMRLQSSLESLYLDFGRISKPDCVALCRTLEGLNKNKSLRNFALDLTKFFVTNDGVLEALSQILPELVHLESLSLRFYKCPDVTNKTIELLSQALGSLKGLRDLALSFQECGRIDDSGIKVICQSLRSMNDLRRIKLQFTQCAGITDETVENLARSITHFAHLESINVALTGCPKIGSRAKENFQRSLDALSYIKNKTVCF